MPRELVLVVVVEAFDGRIFDGAVHAFDMAIRPGVLWFSGAMLDAERRADIFESVRPDRFALGQGFGSQLCSRTASAGRGEMGSPRHRARTGGAFGGSISQHDIDLVGHGFDNVP